MKFVLATKMGDLEVFVEAPQPSRKTDVTDVLADASVFDDRDLPRVPTLQKFWKAVSGFDFYIKELAA